MSDDDGTRATVLDMFRLQAAASPDAIAVRDARHQLSFTELDSRARSLAGHLRNLGVDRDHVVGVCLPRSSDVVVAWLGVLGAGAACLSLDPDYPAGRLAVMFADSGARVLITGGARPDWAPDNVDVISLDHASLDASATGTLDEPTADDRVYVLYTSGSTGEPKGVVMEHGPLARLIAWQIGRDGPSAALPTAQFARIAFDVAFQEIFSTLCGGGTLVIVPDEVRRDPIRVVRFFDEHDVARLFLPTAVLHPVADAARRGPPSSLRHVYVAGEQMKITPAVREWMRAAPACRLHNHYGPTETHVATSHTLSGDPESWPALPPIGRPLPHVRIALRDAAGNLVADGEMGEVYLGGGCVARGYLNRDRLTAERFIIDPRLNGRFYRTGDLAFVRDGELYYRGRADRQVKIRGFRVEPQEVEVALAGHPDIADSLVLAEDNRLGHPRLAAYVVPRNGAAAPVEPDTYRQFLLARLPDFMVPSRWIVTTALPATPSGKADRRGAISASAEFPNAHDAHTLVQAMWTNVLDAPDLGLDDDVFDCGATSLLVMEMQRRLVDALNVEVPVEVLFAHPTIRSLADWLATRPA